MWRQAQSNTLLHSIILLIINVLCIGVSVLYSPVPILLLVGQDPIAHVGSFGDHSFVVILLKDDFFAEHSRNQIQKGAV